MTSQPPPNFSDTAFEDAARMMQEIAATLQSSATVAGDALIDWLYPTIEQGTEFLGRTVAPIADIPFIQYATGVPVLSWVLAASGQVNANKVRTAVADLRVRYPLDSDEQLAQRVVVETAWRAAQVGLLTNVMPPAALFLFAVDIGAVSALQANMIYKIAAIYGFSAESVDRRGEVLAIWGLSTSSSGFLKSGLSFVEILPGIGAAVGITADAAILYGIGFLACRYYEVKLAKGRY